jgi:predicted Zn-dependent peptidase
VHGGSAIKAARATPVGRINLANGMRVLTTESPEEDIVALELLIGVGLIDETTPVTGITHLIQELITERITNDAKGEDRIEATGTVLKLSTEPDYARISVVCTADQFPKVMGWVAGALRQRTTNAEELGKVRKRIVKEIKEGSGGAFTQLYSIFRQTFYRYHPYRQTSRGSEMALERMDPSTVDQFLARYYASNKMVLSIAGRVDRLDLADMVKKEFGPIPATDVKSVEIAWEPKATEKEVTLTGGMNIAWLFVGFPAPGVESRDYAAMKLVQAILGEGLSSRLFTEIREKRSLAYELGAMYPVLRGPSHMLAYTITKPEQVGAARKQLLREVERLKKDGVGSVELQESRLKVIGNYLLERETNTGKAFNLALAEVIGVGYEFDQNFIREIEAVTPKEVQDVAQRYLDNFTLVMARPGGRFYLDF